MAYDHVDIEVKCPLCGRVLNDFQTKDGPQCYDIIGPYSVFDGKGIFLSAYDVCECGEEDRLTWVFVEMPLIPVTYGVVMVSPNMSIKSEVL